MNQEENQKVYKWAKIVLIILAVFLAAETLGVLKNLRNPNPTYNSISITGQGEAISVPDIATFSFSVSMDAKTATDAQNKVTGKIDSILDGLKKMGIEEKDIKTTNYSVTPKYTYEPAVCSPIYCPPTRQVADGFTAIHSILVKVRKTEDVGKALSLAGERGATDLSSISFTVDDPDKVIEEARAEAIKDAKNKARALSKELGVKVVRVVSFFDNTGGGPIPYFGEAMGGDQVKVNVAQVPTIPVGENKITVNVTVTYEIR